MAKAKEAPAELVERSPEEQLVTLLGQLDDEKLAQRIEANKQKIAELVAPLEQENTILQRCRMILRGKRMAADGSLRRKRGGKQRGDAAPPAASSDSALRDRVLARLSLGPGRAEKIAEECGGSPDEVASILRDLKTAGQAMETRPGAWMASRKEHDD